MNILFHHRTRGRGAEGVHIRGVTKGLRELGHTVSLLSLPGADPEEEIQVSVKAEKASAAQPNQQTKMPSPSDSTTTPEKKKKGLLGVISELTKYVPEFMFELFELAYNLVAWARLRKAVKTQQIQLIYERYSLFMFISVWWAKRHDLPIILEVNDSCLVHRVRPLFFASLAKSIEKWIFSNATGLVFISGQFQRVAQTAYPNIADSVISPNAADLDAFVINESAATELRNQLAVQDKVVLGYVGAFVHWHGIDWFVEMIIPRLHEQPNLVLLLVGDGVCYEPIKNLVDQHQLHDRIIMTGRVPHTQVADYIAAMDFGIIPDSNDYGSPMKLFEFMAMAKGMVVPDFSPVEEVVSDDQTSWLFPAGDRHACVERVLGLVENTEKQKLVGANARRFIERERQWRHNAEQLLTLVGA